MDTTAPVDEGQTSTKGPDEPPSVLSGTSDVGSVTRKRYVLFEDSFTNQGFKRNYLVEKSRPVDTKVAGPP